MTTGLVVGMNLEQAGQAVMRKAEELMNSRPGLLLGLWTETGRNNVLIGIAQRGKPSTTMLVPRSEYDGMKLLARLEAFDG
jgi:hypothetical protein